MSRERTVRTIRAFFAINLVNDLLNTLADTIRQARKSCAEAGWTIKWLNPANQHIILRYLGDIDRALPDLMRDGLRPTLAETPTFELTARGLRALTVQDGDVARSVVVVDIQGGTSGLQQIDGTVSALVERLGFKPRGAPLEPWMIVGRVAEAGETPLEELLEPWRDRGFGSCRVQNLFLYQSDVVAPRGEFRRVWALPLLGSTLDDSYGEGGDDFSDPALPPVDEGDEAFETEDTDQPDSQPDLDESQGDPPQSEEADDA
jgi:2'-5' RNA ligase